MIEVRRRADHRTMPWRNGGGVTHEVASSPAGAAEFDWRVSIAEIEASGPFSAFPGVDRVITLVEGPWVDLDVDGTRHRLTPFEPFAFDGGSDTSCEIPSRTVDLNVMTRTGRAWADVVVRRTGETLGVPAGALLVCLDGVVEVRDDDGTAQLRPWDAAILGSGASLSGGAGGVVAVVTLATVPPAPYHHGGLRDALVAEAMRLLEAGEPFSLRAVARGVGVSQTAPYRHFADRAALEDALAASGYRDLEAVLCEAWRPGAPELADLAVAYVAFARARPELFRLMFTSPSPAAPQAGSPAADRAAAVSGVHALIAEAAATALPPGADPAPLATAGWALAHGLATLLLDGKLGDGDDEARVRAAFAAWGGPSHLV